MPYLSWRRVDLSTPGYWADVRPLERLEEVEAISAALARVAGARDVQAVAPQEVTAHYRELLATLAARCIVRWNVDGPDGVLPVTPETAGYLRDADLLAVLEAAGPGYRLRTLLAAARDLAGLPAEPEETAADFSVPSTPSSADSASPTLASASEPASPWNG